MLTPSGTWYIHNQQKPSPLLGHITSSYKWNNGGCNNCKPGLCVAYGGTVRENKWLKISPDTVPTIREFCVMTIPQTAVSNLQTISAIHSFWYSLIDGERFLHPESEVSVSSQLALSVQGHSTSDRPVPPGDLHWNNAARHTSGALLQRPTKNYISTGHSKDSKNNTKRDQNLTNVLVNVVTIEPSWEVLMAVVKSLCNYYKRTSPNFSGLKCNWSVEQFERSFTIHIKTDLKVGVLLPKL